MEARGQQYRRWEGNPTCNARMQPKDIKKYCTMDRETRDLLRTAMEELALSARAYDRILKVSRTIADLNEAETLKTEHVSEAIQYRTLDRQIWT
jgi:magnesium chelatase family protein